MKEKEWVLFFLIVFVVCVVISLIIFNNENFSGDKKINEVKDGDFLLDEVKDDVYYDTIDVLINNMSLEEKIGQMLVLDFSNKEVDDDFKTFFKSINPGGVILMKDNYTTFSATKKLIDDIKSLSKIPLIISTDQEGGRVQRLQYLTDIKATYIPDMFSLGSTLDVNLAKNIGRVMALEMRTLGINVTYAPVLDIFSNPNNKVIGDRSFGSDPNVVSKMSLALANGLEENGVIATFKHFPGHGDTETDSHKKLPVISKSYDEVMNLELIPFKNAINNGAKLIMTAHILFPSIDDKPASLSKKMLTDILRVELGYDGLIITDALNMKALTDNYSDEEIYLEAVNAGVDLLLMPRDPELAIEIIKNNISEDRINESVRRILEFKYNYLESYEYTDKNVLGSDEHQSVVERFDLEG